MNRKTNICDSSKKRFRDKKEAVRALHSTKNRRSYDEYEGKPSKRRECRTYKCPHCKGWHLTSKTTREPRAA